jgi:hypothetical protein
MFSSDQLFVSNTIKTNKFTFCSLNVIYSTKDAFSSAKCGNGLLFGEVPAEYAESAEYAERGSRRKRRKDRNRKICKKSSSKIQLRRPAGLLTDNPKSLVC